MVLDYSPGDALSVVSTFIPHGIYSVCASRKNSLRTQEKLDAHLGKTVSASSENSLRTQEFLDAHLGERSLQQPTNQPTPRFMTFRADACCKHRAKDFTSKAERNAWRTEAAAYSFNIFI